MSLTKSTTRRVALLSSSSLAAAGIAVAASLGFALTPGAALAQVCSQTQAEVSDAAADIVTCPVGTYPTGVQYTAVGDLDLTVRVGSNFGTGGVATTAGASASDTDNLILRFTGVTASSTVSLNAQAFPRLFDVQSQTGDILVALSATRVDNPVFGGTQAFFLTANNAATTHGVYAVSHGGGDVQVLAVGATADTFGLTATGAASIAAIEARSIGGGDVTVGDGARTLSVSGGNHGIWARADGGGDLSIDLGERGSSRGRLYGIRAEAAGTGDLTIKGGGDASGSTSLYGIHATAGSGLLTVEGFGVAEGAGSTGVHISAGGDVVFTGTGVGGQYGIYVANVLAGTTTTLNLDEFDPRGGTVGVFAQGAGELLVNIIGDEMETLDFDFTGMTAPVEVTIANGGIWDLRQTYNVPAGNFDVTIAQNGVMLGGGAVSNVLEYLTPTVVTFADPDFVLTNAGVLIVGEGGLGGGNEAQLRLEGLSEFRHSGVVMFGSPGKSRADIADGSYDDVLVVPGVTWVGEGGRMLMDVDISRSQADCSRAPVTGDLGAADCLQLPGATTEGVTYVTVIEKFPGDRLRPTEEGIVLVEVTGGTSAQGHFALDPDMPGATPMFGGSVDRGLYHYVIGYNEDTQQHTLYGFTGAGAYQLAEYATAVQSLWRVATGSWLDRQADLRGGIEPGVGGGVWLRVSGEMADRDTMIDTVRGGRTFTFDNTARQTSYAVTGGVDLISASTDDMAWGAGLMAGYNYADIEYDAWANTGQLDGFSIGAYGSLIAGGLFVDAAVNANRLILKNDVPGLQIYPQGSILDTIVVSLGAQVDAGWRFPVTDRVFVEPLASVSYVRSKWDDLDVAAADMTRPGINVLFDDPVSLRASLGGRAGMEQDFGAVRTQVSILGRLWNEFEGENTIFLENEAFPNEPNAAVVDDFTGQVTELGVGASLYSGNGLVSGFVNLGGKFSDDYEAKTGSVGVRVSW